MCDFALPSSLIFIAWIGTGSGQCNGLALEFKKSVMCLD